MGLSNPGGRSRRRATRPPAAAGETTSSTLTALTGDGYVEPDDRHIPCFVETCEQLFFRDYDLWLHMSGAHGFEEDDIQAFFMWRTMQGNFESHGAGNENNSDGNMLNNEPGLGDQYPNYGRDEDTHMWDIYPEQHEQQQQGEKDMIPKNNGSNDDNDMSLIDPVLTYMME
jgi:general transcription factor IIIA